MNKDSVTIVKPDIYDPEVVKQHERLFGPVHPRRGGKRAIDSVRRLMGIGGKNSNPIAPDATDILPWWLYDRVVCSAATATLTEYRFFSVPIGGILQGTTSTIKTKNDTNLEQVSQLTAPQHFNCSALRFIFAPTMALVDIAAFLNNYYCEFWIGQKIYAEGPLHLFPGGAGIYGVSTQNNVGTFTNGIANCAAVVDFRMGDNPIGHHILQGQTFYVKVIGTSFTESAVAANVQCALDGILSRGVQ